jgi:hypothetical protein
MKLGDFLANLRGRKHDAPDDDEPARFSAPRVVPERVANPHPFHAVSIRPGLMSCHRAGKLRNIRFLSRTAPCIPLPGCDMSKECTCHFDKHNDRRRGGDRRLFGTLPDSRFYSGQDRRHPGGRRATDSRPQAS